MIKHLIEIYYRAWKKATGEFKEKIESVCIQDYMKNAILLHRSSPVISKVRMVGFKSSAFVTCTPCCLFHPKKKFPLQILYYFHSKKGCDPVEKMLNDLYKPILWKSLSVRRRMDSRTCCTRVGVSCPLKSLFCFFFRFQTLRCVQTQLTFSPRPSPSTTRLTAPRLWRPPFRSSWTWPW